MPDHYLPDVDSILFIFDPYNLFAKLPHAGASTLFIIYIAIKVQRPSEEKRFIESNLR